MALGQHLRFCLQHASQTEDPQRRTLLTVAVIGAGPAGVEIAATLLTCYLAGMTNWVAIRRKFVW